MKNASANGAIQSIIDEMQAATAAAKCHRCGCFHRALSGLTDALSHLPSDTREVIQPVIDRGGLTAVRQKFQRESIVGHHYRETSQFSTAQGTWRFARSRPKGLLKALFKCVLTASRL
jgi:hypothetical protein